MLRSGIMPSAEMSAYQKALAIIEHVGARVATNSGRPSPADISFYPGEKQELSATLRAAGLKPEERARFVSRALERAELALKLKVPNPTAARDLLEIALEASGRNPAMASEIARAGERLAAQLRLLGRGEAAAQLSELALRIQPQAEQSLADLRAPAASR